MPRALYVIHGPAFGGAHMQVQRLTPYLAERGWQTLALLPDEPGNAAERMSEAGIEVHRRRLHRLRAHPDPRLHWRLMAGARREIDEIRSLIRERNVDLVQVHGPTNPHGAIAARLEGAAVVWQLLDTRAPMALRRVTMPLVTRLADAVTTWGTALADAHPGARSLGDRLLTVVPPVDIAQFDMSRRSEARAALGIPDAACAVGTVGVRNPQKGHEYLVRAMARVARRDRDLAVRIIGGPSPAHPQYERTVAAEAARAGLVPPNSFRFVDPHGDVAGLLPGLDVFTMTSVPRSEGMPTVILEAMACGLPVVATDVGAVPELVEHDVTGFVVRPEDPVAIAHAVERLLTDPSLRERLGAAGRRRALEQYAITSVVQVHVRAFEIALAHAAGRRARSRSRGRALV